MERDFGRTGLFDRRQFRAGNISAQKIVGHGETAVLVPLQQMETRRSPNVAPYEASARGMGGAGEAEQAGARATSSLNLEETAITYGIHSQLSYRKIVRDKVREQKCK